MRDDTTKFKKHLLEKSIAVTSVYSIFVNVLTNNYSTEGEAHDFWEYIYVDEGKLLLENDNKYFELVKGDFFLHQPMGYHRHYVMDSEATLFITSFDCDSPILKDIAERKIAINPMAKMIMRESISLSNNIFCEIKPPFEFIKLDQYDKLYEQMLSNTIENVLLSVLSAEEDVAPFNLTLINDYAEGKELSSVIHAYMVEHLYTSVSIEDLCKLVGLGKTTLSHRFKEEAGVSIIEYYNSLKISKAEELIASGKFNVTQVSIALNFTTSQYFSKVFKKYTGVSPKEYSNNLKKKKIGRLVYK